MKDEKNTQFCEAELQNTDQEGKPEETKNKKSLGDPLNKEHQEENTSECDHFDDEPVEIHLDEEDFKRASADSCEIDTRNNEIDYDRKKKRSKQKYDENVLQEYSVISFIFGLLSCSVFIGNAVFALIGIGFAIASKIGRHKSIYSTVGMVSGIVGLLICLFLSMLPIAFILLLIISFCVFLLLDFLMFGILGVFLLVVYPMINLLLSFLAKMMLPW